MKKLNLHARLLAGIAMFLLVSCASDSKIPETPNIIFILADDLGYGDLGVYGQELIQTPNIDELAAAGMRFTQHYAGNTVCAPSRCALMTGFHMGHAEIRGNGQVDPYGQMPLSQEAFTVADALKGAGYATALIGKWGLGVEVNSGFPLHQGFDFFYGYLDQVLAHNYYPEYLWRNDKKEYLDNEVLYLDSTAWHAGLGSYSTKKKTYSHDLFVEEAMQFIRNKQEGPFFLYLPLTIPHDNGEERPGERQEVPDFGIYAGKDWPKEQKGYAAMITRMDRDVGKIRELLKELGLEENTLVFFASDNGPMADREFTAYFNSNGPLRGGKRDMYEGGIRVPLIASWKGIIGEGSVSDHVSAFWDFLPTVCELAGVNCPEEADGISFLPELLGQEQEKHEVLYWEIVEQGGQQAIRKGSWKLVRDNIISEPPGTLELYNLNDDQSEERNLATEYPEIAAQLLEAIEENRTESESFRLYR